MKRVIPNLLLFFCLIPWGASLLFAVVDCIFNIKYLDWLWIPDFCMVIFDLLSYYLLEIAVFAMFGIFAAYIFFGRPIKAVFLTLGTLVMTFALPYSRYLIHHIFLSGVMYDIAMLDYFNDARWFAETMLMNGILFLMACLLTKLFYRMISKKGEDLPTKMLSLKDPHNIASLIFCVAAVLLATILFFDAGAFTGENILSLIVEYAINAIRFLVIAFTVITTVRWNKKVYHKA
jgi:hypothetical protein